MLNAHANQGWMKLCVAGIPGTKAAIGYVAVSKYCDSSKSTEDASAA